MASGEPDAAAWKAGIGARKANEPVESCPRYTGEDKNQLITDWVKGWLIAELETPKQDAGNEAPTEGKDAGTDAGTEPPKDATEVGKDAGKDAPATDEESTTSTAENVAERGDSQGGTESPTSEAHEAAIQELLEQIKAGNDLRQEDGNENWAEGHTAAIDELPVETCPANLSGTDQVQWLKGWMYGDSFTGAL